MKMESYRRELRKRIQALEERSKFSGVLARTFIAGEIVAYTRALRLTRKIPL